MEEPARGGGTPQMVSQVHGPHDKNWRCIHERKSPTPSSPILAAWIEDLNTEILVRRPRGVEEWGLSL